MKCPNCGSENVQVQLVETGQQTNKKVLDLDKEWIIQLEVSQQLLMMLWEFAKIVATLG